LFCLFVCFVLFGFVCLFVLFCFFFFAAMRRSWVSMTWLTSLVPAMRTGLLSWAQVTLLALAGHSVLGHMGSYLSCSRSAHSKQTFGVDAFGKEVWPSVPRVVGCCCFLLAKLMASSLLSDVRASRSAAHCTLQHTICITNPPALAWPSCYHDRLAPANSLEVLLTRTVKDNQYELF
jgi:hypothetical protein